MAEPTEIAQLSEKACKCEQCVVSEVPVDQKRICIIGSGNWGSTLSIIVGENAKRHPHLYDTVNMQVHEEMVDGRKLTEIINQEHENIKYLPGYKIPINVVAVADINEASKDADLIIVVTPHLFIPGILEKMVGKIKPNACAVSLVKGFSSVEGEGILLISAMIRNALGINVSVLMGANIAHEIAAGMFAETTLGCDDEELTHLWTSVFETDNFAISSTTDIAAVEIFSGFKNVIAVGAGLIDGLKFGESTKAILIRMGVIEMMNFIDEFYPGCSLCTFFESCGLADIVATCSGGRNRKMGEMIVLTGKDSNTVEKEQFDGQIIQGPLTAAEITSMLRSKSEESRFPILCTIHKICIGELKPEEIVDAMKSHPAKRLALRSTTL